VNISVIVVRVWRRIIWRGTDIECYCVCCESLGRAIERGTVTECFRVCCGGGVGGGSIERNGY
jgi:hypothetical protein